MNLLKPILENKGNSILKLQVYMENIEDAYEEYDNAILDIFDHQLTIEEADLTLGFVEHNLKYEYRYIKFIEGLYEYNSCQPIIIEINLNELQSLDILRILEGLDYKDKLIFIDIIRHSENKSNMFTVENKELLHLLIKLSTREILFSIFHFTKIQTTIVGGWDLSFPIFFNNKNNYEQCLSIAKKNELCFRSIKFNEHH